MSRLILTPTLELHGEDPATGYEVDYSSETGDLTIGCQTHSLAEWKRKGTEIITATGNAAVCHCDFCARSPNYPARVAAANKASKAQVRKQLPRLTKLIAHIERAEAALKKSLRAQTKRT